MSGGGLIHRERGRVAINYSETMHGPASPTHRGDEGDTGYMVRLNVRLPRWSDGVVKLCQVQLRKMYLKERMGEFTCVSVL